MKTRLLAGLQMRTAMRRFVPALVLALLLGSAASLAQPELLFSTTNVQVAGVDEPDFVKNDGAHLYVLVGDSVVVVAASPPHALREVARARLEGTPLHLFLDGDRLAALSVVGDVNADKPPAVKVTVLDVTQRPAPTVARELYIEGAFLDARLIGGAVHLVTSSSVRHAAWCCPDGWDPERLVVTTISLTDSLPPTSASVVAARGLVYASPSALYVASPALVGRDDTTAIHKFTLGGEGPRYVASGRVEGRVLNQFSMDEFEDSLRVATTTEASANLYLLASPAPRARRLKILGSIRDLAPNEKIFASRFVGERGFVVTHPEVPRGAAPDPLFAVDMRRMSVKGTLTADGFSTYLHPVGWDHLLAIGNSTDQTTVTGMDLSIFDVTDLANPRLAHRTTLPGAYSAALYEHKAYTFFEPAATLVIPLKDCANGFSGLAVYDVGVGTGYTVRGRIDHADLARELGCTATPAVTRSAIIGSAIFSISADGIKGSDLREPNVTLGRLRFDRTE